LLTNCFDSWFDLRPANDKIKSTSHYFIKINWVKSNWYSQALFIRFQIVFNTKTRRSGKKLHAMHWCPKLFNILITEFSAFFKLFLVFSNSIHMSSGARTSVPNANISRDYATFSNQKDENDSVADSDFSSTANVSNTTIALAIIIIAWIFKEITTKIIFLSMLPLNKFTFISFSKYRLNCSFLVLVLKSQIFKSSKKKLFPYRIKKCPHLRVSSRFLKFFQMENLDWIWLKLLLS
jgi:hypothetical protein